MTDGAPQPDRLAPFRGAHEYTDRPIPLATVSGIASTDPTMIDWFARSTPVTIVTSKSIQLDPNPGNREPVITEPEPGCFGNAVGLRNPGVEIACAGFASIADRRAEWPHGTLLCISIAGRDEHEFARLVDAVVPFADLIELNLSCPHAHGGYGSIIGCNPDLVRSVVVAAVEQAKGVPVIAKLTPNTEHLARIARQAVAAGASALAAINTVGPVQYREPSSGAVILSNPAPEGATGRERAASVGRGGQSGRWIRRRALECVREIRAAVGRDVPLIGMGGVERPEDAEAMRRAGADVVGVGSALALVHQADWPGMLSALADPEAYEAGRRTPAGETGESGTDEYGVRNVYRTEAGMRFHPVRVGERRELGGGLFEIELEATIDFLLGQVCFLWLPAHGEKPFSPALATPATFLVRRRGPFTEALGRLERGDALYVRGPYGEGVGVRPARPVAAGEVKSILTSKEETRATDRREVGIVPDEVDHAWIFAAGSGAALVPHLADRLHMHGVEVAVWLGLRDEVAGVPLEGAIREQAALTVVHDRGEIGRALVVAETTLAALPTDRRRCALFAIGPEAFLSRAVTIGDRTGVPRDRIVVSLEQPMLCGVGLCGACHNDGILTCQFGTFVSADRWVGAPSRPTPIESPLYATEERV